MTIFKPSLVSGDKVPMTVTHPKHFVPGDRHFTSSGAAVLELGEKIGGNAVTRSGVFDDAMLQALDRVSGAQEAHKELVEMSFLEPGSVDAHDIGIAEAKANLSLDIARTILDRIVRGWKELINTR